MQNVYFVHGANATRDSFNYITAKLDFALDNELTAFHYLEYKISDHMEEVEERLMKLIAKNGRGIIVGHSLGGMLAYVAAHKSDLIDGFVTISSPLGGSEAAAILKWIHAEYGQLSPGGYLARQVASIKCTKDNFVVVTESPFRTPMFHEPNDGVVTVRSQQPRQDLNIVTLPSNHFEGLLNDDVAFLISSLLTKSRNSLRRPDTHTQQFSVPNGQLAAGQQDHTVVQEPTTDAT